MTEIRKIPTLREAVYATLMTFRGEPNTPQLRNRIRAATFQTIEEFRVLEEATKDQRPS